MSTPQALLFSQALAALKPAIPITLGRQATATRFGLVTPRIGYPYVLDRVTLIAGPTAPGRLGFQLYIDDNNDLTDLTALTGSPVFLWRGDRLVGDLAIPYFDYTTAPTWTPRLRVAAAGTYIKALLDDASIGNDHLIICNLQQS